MSLFEQRGAILWEDCLLLCQKRMPELHMVCLHVVFFLTFFLLQVLGKCSIHSGLARIDSYL